MQERRRENQPLITQWECDKCHEELLAKMDLMNERTNRMDAKISWLLALFVSLIISIASATVVISTHVKVPPVELSYHTEMRK